MVTGQAPGEQNRYDRHQIESLARDNGYKPPADTALDTPDALVDQIMSAIGDARQAQQKSAADMADKLCGIDERLARLEELLEKRDDVVEEKKGFWKRLFGG
jgi:flagellar motility protein MotE (MotC chaperone)